MKAPLAIIGAGLIGALLVAAAGLIANDTAPTRPDLMLSRPCQPDESCTSTWTLTSRLGDILTFYEHHLGRRDRTRQLLGIEFTTSKRPQVWYPDFGDGPTNLTIQLTANARTDNELAVFQLGHEAFHLLDPVAPEARTSVLEEGLASLFAVAYMTRAEIHSRQRFLDEPNYRSAIDLVGKLQATVTEIAPAATAAHDKRSPPPGMSQAFVDRLRALRARTHSFSRLTPGDIRAVFPDAPQSLADQLAAPFPGA